MNRFYFNKEEGGKLVRDKVAELTISQGHDVKVRKLGETALTEEIWKKMSEEVSEVSEAVGNINAEKEELGDVLTIFKAYIKQRGFDLAEIEKIADNKTKEKGGFEKGEVIEYVDLKSDGEDYEFWLEKFRQNPERYIEEEIDDK